MLKPKNNTIITQTNGTSNGSSLTFSCNNVPPNLYPVNTYLNKLADVCHLFPPSVISWSIKKCEKLDFAIKYAYHIYGLNDTEEQEFIMLGKVTSATPENNKAVLKEMVLRGYI